MKSIFAALVPALLVAPVLVGCGFSEEKATKFCNQEQEARGASACFSDATYEECLEMYQECGDDVDVDESGCGPVYSCP